MRFNVFPVEIVNSGNKIMLLNYLMRHEAPMSEREISSVLKMSHMSVNRILKEFSQHNLVTYVTTGKAHLWKLNKNGYWCEVLSGLIKGLYEIKLPLEHLKSTIKNGITLKLIKQAVLFGSVARGQENTGSDIDLFLLVKNEKYKRRVTEESEDVSNKCLDLYGNRLSAYVLTENEISKKINSNIIEEIQKGIFVFREK